MFAFPPCGGFTLRILHASSSVRPEEMKLWEEVEVLPAADWEYLEEAEACRYASAKARPKTRAPTTTAWVIIRCAW